MSLFPHSKRAQHPSQGGFALVIALSLMAFVLLLLLSITTLVQVESRSSRIQMQRMEAEQSALLGLQLALGELQKAAGPDQRVTATADVLSNDPAKEPIDGRHRWAGVWDTSSYSPATPDTKTFKRWLVSSSVANGLISDDDANSAANTNPYTIFEAVDASGARDLNNDVIVEKIPFTSAGSLSESAYAYWVEDEGVKADLAWNEGTFTDDERKQAARLSAAPGVDHGVFEGPFSSGVSYPLEKGSGYVDNLEKALSPAAMPLVMGDTSAHRDWLKEHRHNMGMHSRGVLADVKKGGLRRDLSLAFEMDDDAEAANATLFNKQTGEFVGSGDPSQDPLSAPRKPNGLPTFERFLWRDWNGAGNPFSDEIKVAYDSRRPSYQPVMRGPNWWALRDYANLYKRLSGSDGDYSMQARPYYPNRSTEGYAYSDYHSPFGIGQTWDREITEGTPWPSNNRPGLSGPQYLYRPAQANYAPVNLGVSVLIGIKATNEDATHADLAVTADPFFYFWNPFNRKLRCENIVVTLGRGIPGRVLLKYQDTSGVDQEEDLNLHTLLQNNVNNRIGDKILYLIKGPFILDPGEVVIAQPLAATGGVPGTGEAALGYSLDADTGIIMTNLKLGAIRLPLSTSVGWAYVQSGSNAGSSSLETRHEMDTSLPGDKTLTQILADLPNNIGEQTQHNLHVLWSGTEGPATFVNAAGEAGSTDVVRTETVNNLVGVKEIFGAHAILVKPASDGAENATPFEVFARLNPAPMLMNRDYYVQSFPNQVYRHVTANSGFSVRDQMGIDFSGSSRGTFWGLSYQNTGSTSVPMLNIPSSPLYSLASFADANLSINGTDPMRAVGNSWSNPGMLPLKAYGGISPSANTSWANVRIQDFSWLINEALFDRYYLSGIAREFDYSGPLNTYRDTSTLAETLENFYENDPLSAKANPVLQPYIPEGKTADDVVSDLDPDDAQYNTTTNIYDGYKKFGAYSMVKGAFNVNSTSVKAWEAMLSANKNLDVAYVQSGGTDDGNSQTPFPSSSSPVAPGGGAKAHWSGLPRLTDGQITALATEIVEQVKLRGPFMSFSDFVNHRVGPIDNEKSYTGAIQAAIDLQGSDINNDSRVAAKNSASADSNALEGTLAYSAQNIWLKYPGPLVGRKSTTGIPGDITQADILRPIAPRLNARSDTFRIRAYGEVQDSLGNVSSAICEAVVQRVPGYVNRDTSVGGNDPWDDNDTLTSDRPLGTINQQFGRRFKIHSVRWLNSNDV